MALQAASVSPYDRVKAAVARSKATTSSNRIRYDPDLVKCHLCPEVNTLSVIQKHIKTQHSNRPTQSKHDVCNDLQRSSSPQQQQQIMPRATDSVETARPDDQEVAI